MSTLHPSFFSSLQHQHVEAPRIPKPGDFERPAAGSTALWELWVHHGINFILVTVSVGPLVLCSNLLQSDSF